MSKLASVNIPIFSPSLSSSPDPAPNRRWRLQRSRSVKRYGDEPLPVKLSDKSPRRAQIVDRKLDEYGFVYTLRVDGNREIHGVDVDKVLDYVSAQQLEVYENRRFEEEAELQRIADAEDKRIERERAERRNERARVKGTAGYRDPGAVADASDAAQMVTGKHGRARPNYKHLFKKFKERRRRKRDPVTDELLPLSDEDDGLVLESSEDETPFVQPSSRQMRASSAPPKRRRRKRDKVTRELLPLSPGSKTSSFDKKKRQRRKRHPRTNQLMPIGWRYDPNAPEERAADGLKTMSPALKRLSLSQEHPAKRLKLSSRSASSSSEQAVKPSKQQAETSEHDEESIKSEMDPSKPRPSQVRATGSSRGKLALPANLQSMSTSAIESSPEPPQLTSMLRPNAQTLEISDESGAEPDELGEDEWFIEAVVGHTMSDPRTHPPEYGAKPIMLYHVKWEGFDELTWEPTESFPDRSVVDHYKRQLQRQAVIRKVERDNSVSKPPIALAAPATKTATLGSPIQLFGPVEAASDGHSNEEDTDEDAEAWEVEAILGHHLSDPRTHRPEHGTKPVMLYKVKWKGYIKPSWEPLTSFSDRTVVDAYRRKVGLRSLEGQ